MQQQCATPPTTASGKGKVLNLRAPHQVRCGLRTAPGCQTSPCPCARPQTLSCWLHLTAVRLFVESTLRYGLPPTFQAAVVRPVEKREAELRNTLARVFHDGALLCSPPCPLFAFRGSAGLRGRQRRSSSAAVCRHAPWEQEGAPGPVAGAGGEEAQRVVS